MKFCAECGSMLSITTIAGELFLNCNTCGETIKAAPEDTLLDEINYTLAVSGGKYDVMEEIAPGDTAGKKIAYKCPGCSAPYMTHIYVGNECVSKYVCDCGKSIETKNILQ